MALHPPIRGGYQAFPADSDFLLSRNQTDRPPMNTHERRLEPPHLRSSALYLRLTPLSLSVSGPFFHLFAILSFPSLFLCVPSWLEIRVHPRSSVVKISVKSVVRPAAEHIFLR